MLRNFLRSTFDINHNLYHSYIGVSDETGKETNCYVSIGVLEFLAENDERESEDFRADVIDSIMDKVEDNQRYAFVIKLQARNSESKNATPFWSSVVSAVEIDDQ